MRFIFRLHLVHHEAIYKNFVFYVLGSKEGIGLVSQEKQFDLVWDINTVKRLPSLLDLLIVLAISST